MSREASRISHILGCIHGGAYPAKEDFGKGFRYFVWCETCQNIVTKETGAAPGRFMSEPWMLEKFPHVVLSRVPLRETSMPRYCEGPCKQFGRCQQHHVLPKGLLSGAAKAWADDWPLFWLCKECHDLWHSTVTPGLETAYDAREHVLILSNYLKEPYLKALHEELGKRLNNGPSAQKAVA